MVDGGREDRMGRPVVPDRGPAQRRAGVAPGQTGGLIHRQTAEVSVDSVGFRRFPPTLRRFEAPPGAGRRRPARSRFVVTTATALLVGVGVVLATRGGRSP